MKIHKPSNTIISIMLILPIVLILISPLFTAITLPLTESTSETPMITSDNAYAAWNRIIPRPDGNWYIQEMMLDPSNNIINVGWDYNVTTGAVQGIVEKISPNGNLLWRDQWNNSEWDELWGIDIDASGNIYAAGFGWYGTGGNRYNDLHLVKILPNGTQDWMIVTTDQWDQQGYDVAVNTSGDLYVTGELDGDLALIKCSSTGTNIWNATTSLADEGFAIAIDSNSDSIYVLGREYSSGDNNLVLFKFHANGTIIWNKSWGGSDFDEGTDVAVDAAGNIYCVGSSNSFEAVSYDFTIIKVSPNGAIAWNTTWGSSGTEYGKSIGVDATGNIYCVGLTTMGVGDDIALIKFHPDGTKAWNTTWGGLNFDYPYDVKLDSNANIYCVGLTDSYGAGSDDLLLLKFYPNGTLMWNVTWGGYAEEKGVEIVIDSNDDIYCLGESASFGDPIKDLALVKFLSNSTRVWNITWGTTNTENAHSLAINPCDELYVTYDIEAAGIPLLLEKFFPNGTMAWNTSWIGPVDLYGIDVALDSKGAAYILAIYNLSAPDFLLVKFLDPFDCVSTGGIPGFESIIILLVLFVLVHVHATRKHRKII